MLTNCYCWSSTSTQTGHDKGLTHTGLVVELLNLGTTLLSYVDESCLRSWVFSPMLLLFADVCFVPIRLLLHKLLAGFPYREIESFEEYLLTLA